MTATYETNLNDLLLDIQKMLITKHHDYGANNLKKRGMLGIMTRLDDKMARIDNLLEEEEHLREEAMERIDTLRDGKEKPEQIRIQESIEDTLKDIAGYAIQAILLREEKL